MGQAPLKYALTPRTASIRQVSGSYLVRLDQSRLVVISGLLVRSSYLLFVQKVFNLYGGCLLR